MADPQTRLTLWGVEIFLATIEAGSISQAAARLGASPSTVSQQLSNLETALGMRLLDRGARPVSLTAAGRLFLRRARVIDGEVLAARSELTSLDMSRLRQLRLGMIEDFDADVTPRLLSEMSADLGTCHFVLETGASYRLAEMLESRTLDVIVAADLDLSAEWMEVHPLLTDPFLVAAPPGCVDPDMDSDADILAALLDLPFIRYSSRQMMGRQIDAHLKILDLDIPRRFELDSYHAIMAMVASGAGWTITTPLGVTRAQRFRKGVDVMPLPFQPLSRRISLFARRDSANPVPHDMAARLRPLLQGLVVDPCLQEMPWLRPTLRVEGWSLAP